MRFAGGLTAVLFGTAIITVQVQIATALKPTEVSPIAQKITVRIDGAGTGSGVIIERQGNTNTYTILTNWHVVKEPGSYTVHTPDGKQYTFKHSQARQLSKDVDLAVFQFTSNQNYQVAEKGSSEQVTPGTTIHVAGYPQGSSNISFLSGQISSLEQNPKNGYAFIYTVNPLPGMSGGPILDEEGKLVGIHGRVRTRPDTNATTVYGIPLKTYLSLAPSVKPSAITSPPVNVAAKFSLVETLTGHSTKVIPLSYLGGRFSFGGEPESYIKAQVNSVAISPDGKTLASGSYDNTIKIWNLATGEQIRILKGHYYSVNSVAFSLDGKTLASGSEDNTIKIWNLITGQEISTLKGHSDPVYSVAFSPDGRTLASGSSDNSIKIWNLITGQEISTLKGHSDPVYSVAFSPDGKTLASGSQDKTIKIWNLTTGQVIRTLKGRSTAVNSVAISPDGKTLASGSDDNTIKIWNLTTGQEIRALKGHSYGGKSVAFSPDGRTLASGGLDATIKIWNLSTGQEISTLKSHSAPVNSVAFSPDGKTLASGSWDATIKIWRLSE
ncbi:MAG: trypsin-like peptidase domain-containing protein [Nostoc sp. DedSLP03]|uniref:WD40 domain-containing protein n=1 Tax=Nostoc sp. DedSLP03 TaxID=3075400 RepID=UPI002AD3AECB|nr:trypsin-like peptidase domain-containing protein [Nostoc sp. DedSLP03]MDZ7965263.1 trypsin-like peptidase domain-containing protein [Nostoc sp. DedSLP03]